MMKNCYVSRGFRSWARNPVEGWTFPVTAIITNAESGHELPTDDQLHDERSRPILTDASVSIEMARTTSVPRMSSRAPAGIGDRLIILTGSEHIMTY